MPRSLATNCSSALDTFGNWARASTRFLFLGNRTTQKIMGIVREEMNKIGQEFYLPALIRARFGKRAADGR